jgi:hypothetical protein
MLLLEYQGGRLMHIGEKAVHQSKCYLLVIWEGSSYDASIIVERLDISDGPRIPKGKFYPTDVRYAYHPGILPPFKSTRYHHNEFFARFFPKKSKEFFQSRTLNP